MARRTEPEAVRRTSSRRARPGTHPTRVAHRLRVGPRTSAVVTTSGGAHVSERREHVLRVTGAPGVADASREQVEAGFTNPCCRARGFINRLLDTATLAAWVAPGGAQCSRGNET